MRVPLLAHLSLLFLVACGLPEKRVFEEIERPMCEHYAACIEDLTVEDCLTIPPTTDRDGCDYDPAAAKQCAKALEDASCTTNPDSMWVDFVPPKECGDNLEKVYVCE